MKAFGMDRRLCGKREARVSRLDFEIKPLDPTSIVKSLDGREKKT